MDFELDEAHRELRDVARAWVDKEVIPYAKEWDRAESVDPALIGKLGEMGFLGIEIPEEYGGSGGDALAYCVLLEELGRGDSSVRGIVSVSLGLVSKSIKYYGTDKQKQRFLPRLCAGEALGCFALTEPDIGSDASNLTSKAERDGDDWLISGTKIFITNGTWAEVAVVFARTGGPGARGITAFLVPTDTPGLTRTEIHGKLGLRGQRTAELVFDRVRVPDTLRLGQEGQGFKIAMAALDKGRMGVAAGCVGVAKAALEAAVQYSTERVQFGRPIASYQLVQEILADIAVEVDAARLLAWRVADLIEKGKPFGTEASMAKLFASECAVRSTNKALEVFGGYGFIDEYPVSKHLRDARVLTLYEGTSQIQKLLIGRALTGVSAFV